MSEPAAPQFFDESGKPLEGAELHQAWAAGAAHVAAGTQVHMLDSQGELRLVPAEQVAAARAKGYAPAPEKLVEERQLQKEHGGGAQQALAGAEGLARGATLGLSDVALGAALGRGYSESADKRKEANPYTAGATQLAGALAPSLVTGGEAEGVAAAELAGEGAGATEAVGGLRGALSAVGDAAKTATSTIGAPVRAVGKVGGLVEHGILHGLKSLGYTGESLAGRAAAKGLAYAGAGAIEGAAFGAGDTISESVLKGEPLTSEALVASLGRNALFGGAIGGSLGALGELVPAAISKVLPDKEALEKFAYKKAGKQLGQDFEKIGKRKGIEAAEEAKNVVAKDLLDYEIKTGPNAGKTVLQSAHNPTDISLNLTKAKQEIGAARRGVIENIDAAVASNPEVAAVAAPDLGEYLARVKAEVTDPLRSSKAPSIQRLADRVDRELSVLTEEHAARIQALGEAANENAVAPPTLGDLLNVRKDLREVFQPPAPAGGGLPPPPPKSAKYLEKAERILADYIDEKAGHALTVMGEDANAYRDLTRQYASFATMDQIAQKQVARYAKNRTVSLTDHMLGLGGFLAAIGSGNIGALSAMGLGGAASFANKMLRERGNAVLADIAYRVARKDSLIDAAAHALATSSENLTRPIELAQQAVGHKSRERLAESEFVPLGRKELKKDFEETRDRVREMGTPEHQQAQIAHAIGPVHSEYPEAAAGMSQQLIRAHQYLAAALPAQQGGNPLSPNARSTAVPPREMAKFLSKANAVMDPESVISGIARGRIDEDSVDALQNVYPSIFNQLKERVMQNIASNKEEMPFQRVIHVSAVFGFDGDSSLAPERFAGIQQSIQQINAPPPNQNAPGSPGPTRKAKPGSPKTGSPYKLPGQATPGEH